MPQCGLQSLKYSIFGLSQNMFSDSYSRGSWSLTEKSKIWGPTPNLLDQKL